MPLHNNKCRMEKKKPEAVGLFDNLKVIYVFKYVHETLQ